MTRNALATWNNEALGLGNREKGLCLITLGNVTLKQKILEPSLRCRSVHVKHCPSWANLYALLTKREVKIAGKGEVLVFSFAWSKTKFRLKENKKKERTKARNLVRKDESSCLSGWPIRTHDSLPPA